MAEFLGTPKVQYFETTTNAPLVGGKLYTYEPGSGSTTPKATYSTIADALATTNPNTNPIILNSRGEATVVLAGSTKLVLNRADDTNVWTVDAVGATGNNIYDSNGNEILIVSSVNNAVNEITITNAATGDSPSVEATGGDTNVNLKVLPKGTGGVDLGTKLIDTNENEILTLTPVASAVNYLDVSNAATAGTVGISAKGDDTNVSLSVTSKGTGYLVLNGLKVPTGDGTVGQILNTDGAAQLRFSSYSATQSDQETATSNAVFVTPGTQKYHPLSTKAWAKFGVSGNILASNGVASISDTGTGQAAVNWSTAFFTTNYCVQVTLLDNANDSISTCYNQSTGAANVQNVQVGASFKDPATGWFVCAWGDLP